MTCCDKIPIFVIESNSDMIGFHGVCATLMLSCPIACRHLRDHCELMLAAIPYKI